ncbi:MAG: hypothetical protein ACYDCC_05185 [Actinomycetota bacterium]
MRAPLAIVEIAQDIVHYLVIVILLMITAVVLYHTVVDLLVKPHDFAERVIGGVDGVLFAIIIGIISAVRHILSLGAKLTLSKELSGGAFRHPQIELGVNAAVVLALSVGLLLVRHNDPTIED